MKLKEAVKQINPLEYANLLKKIELLDCYLKQVNYECPSRKTDGQATYNFTETVGQVSIVEELVSINVKYIIKAYSDEENIFELDAEYVLNYSIEGALSEEFFEIFKSYTLPLQSYPYFRELTHSLTTRTGLSGLILPLRRVLKKESKEVEGQKKESKKSKKEAQSAKASN